jgi:hypothetical protein
MQELHFILQTKMKIKGKIQIQSLHFNQIGVLSLSNSKMILLHV